jgi:hypothetical protein
MASAVASNSKDVSLPLVLRKVLAEPACSARHQLSSSRGMTFGRDYDSCDSDDDDRLLCAHDFPGLILSPAGTCLIVPLSYVEVTVPFRSFVSRGGRVLTRRAFVVVFG